MSTSEVFKRGNLRVVVSSVGTNVGIIEEERRATVIDPAGLDIDEYPKTGGLALVTHFHLDHTLDAPQLKKEGYAVLVPRLEAPFVEEPVLYTEIVVGGWALPFRDNPLNRRYRPFTPDGYSNDLPYAVSTPGHTPDHQAYVINGVAFVGDAVFTRDLLDKVKAPLVLDIEKELETLDKLKKISYDYMVPGHGKVLAREDAIEEIERYMNYLLELEEKILEVIEPGDTLIDVCRKVVEKLKPRAQFFMHLTTKAYLRHLAKQGKVKESLDKHGIVRYFPQ